jgi:hypothetical protein
MDSVVAQLFSRLSMFLAREFDFQIDAERFAKEPEYAAQVLGLVEESGDYEFAMIAAQIRKRQLDLFSLRNASFDATEITANFSMNSEALSVSAHN